MKIKTLIKHLCFLASINIAVFAQLNSHVSKVGTTAASFLQLGVGGRAIAMGDAYASISDDVSSIYWNPAGIASLKRSGAEFYHSPWVADINYNFAGAVVNLGRYGAIGASLISVTMDDMPVRTIEYPEGNGELFGAGNTALGLSYGRQMTSNFAVGITVKHISEKIWHMTASTFASDIGVKFQTKNRGIRIGMSVSNYGSKMRLSGRDTKISVDIDESKLGNNDRIDANLDTWSWALPLIFRFGLSSDLINTGFMKLTAAVDAIHPNDNVEYVNVGAEYSIKDMFFLRVGQSSLFMSDAEQGLSFGAGYHYRLSPSVGGSFDYVYKSYGDLGYISGFSLGLIF